MCAVSTSSGAGGIESFRLGISAFLKKYNYSPFLHYRLVSSFKKINIGNTGDQNPPEGGFWFPVFPIFIFVNRKPADNAKMVNTSGKKDVFTLRAGILNIL